MGKTYRNTDTKGRSQGKSGRYDDPEIEMDKAMEAKNKSKKGKSPKKQSNGKSE